MTSIKNIFLYVILTSVLMVLAFSGVMGQSMPAVIASALALLFLISLVTFTLIYSTSKLIDLFKKKK